MGFSSRWHKIILKKYNCGFYALRVVIILISPITVRMSKTYVKDKVPPKKVRNFKNYTPERLVSNLMEVNWDDVYAGY